MSGYENFGRCVVCRSKYNLQNYRGEFEITMLINSLYLTVMHCIETKKIRQNSADKVVQWLRENNIISDGGNEFRNMKILRNLRNGLAHFNLKVPDPPKKDIDTIKIWVRPWSKADKSYQKFNDGEIENAICVFTFSANQLKSFTKYVIDLVLESLDDKVCRDCKYREEA